MQTPVAIRQLYVQQRPGSTYELPALAPALTFSGSHPPIPANQRTDEIVDRDRQILKVAVVDPTRLDPAREVAEGRNPVVGR